MFCSKACLKYDRVWREPRHIACHLGSQFTSPFGWWFFRILFSSAHWLNWQWLAEGDPHTWNTCFPPVSLMSHSHWTLNRKLAGILHGWVGFSTFLQESVPNWHHMGGHLCVTLPVLHQAHLPTCERDQGRPESVQENWQKNWPKKKAKPGGSTFRFMSWVAI